MGKGILLEVEGRAGVVLTPTGEFKRVSLPQGACEIGDEIAFEERASMAARWGWVAAAAAAFLLIATPVGYQSWTLAQPAAVVLIDINPSLKLTLNGREQVIDAQGLNADGEAVLEGVDWQKHGVDDVVRQVTAQAVAKGKLDPTREGSAVLMAVAPAGEKELKPAKAEALAEKSKQAVQAEVKAQAESKGAEPKAEVASFEASSDELEEAKEQGLTLPKFIIYQELVDDYPELTPEVIEGKGPGQFLQEMGVSPSEIFSQAAEHRKNAGEAQPASGNGNDKETTGKPENPGRPENPGKSDQQGVGQGQDNPGQGQDNPGQGQDNPGQGQDNPGQGQDNPGQGRDNPGQGRDNPGQGRDNPGQGKGQTDKGGKPDEKLGQGGQGGQENGQGKANEGSKGNSNP